MSSEAQFQGTGIKVKLFNGEVRQLDLNHQEQGAFDIIEWSEDLLLFRQGGFQGASYPEIGTLIIEEPILLSIFEKETHIKKGSIQIVNNGVEIVVSLMMNGSGQITSLGMEFNSYGVSAFEFIPEIVEEANSEPEVNHFK